MNLNFKKNKKNITLLIILLVSITTIALSFAYFVAQSSSPANTNANVGTEVGEKLIFTPGLEMTLNASQDNFGEGDGSLSTATTSSATLVANSSSGSASQSYNVYFDITANDFVYSQNSDIAELLLTITDPEGNVLTNIEGLTYKNVIDASTGETISGFDITEYNGLIKVKEGQVITTTSSTTGTTQNWNAKITFINLDTDQVLNEGKNLEADFILTQEKMLNGSKMVNATEFHRIINNMPEGSSIDEIEEELRDLTSMRYLVYNIEFNDSINESRYNAATLKWDISENQDNSVVAYAVEDREEMQEKGIYSLYIESNGKIIAHEDEWVTPTESLPLTTFEFPHTETISFNNSYDTSNMTNMSYMFDSFYWVKNIDLSSFNTSNVTNMAGMFSGCESLEYIDLSSFDTSNVTDMNGMFLYNTALKSLDLSAFNLKSDVNTSYMFFQVDSLENNLIVVNEESKSLYKNHMGDMCLVDKDVYNALTEEEKISYCP